MRQNARQENLDKVKYVYQRNGKWFMRYDTKSIGVQLPEDMAQIINLALSAKWTRQIQETRKIRPVQYRMINCHQTAFRAMGIVSNDQLSSSTMALSVFADEDFKFLPSLDRLTSYIKNAIENKIGLIQIKTDQESPLHSFLAGVDTLGRIICFEKEGRNYPFRIATLKEVSEKYIKPFIIPIYWAAGPVDKIKLEARAKVAHATGD